MKTTVRLLPDDKAFARVLAEAVAQAARQDLAGKKKKIFRIALTGGGSPRGLYRLLGGRGYRRRIPWRRVHFFWGDERFVPLTHPESNFRQARDLFLRKIPVPPVNVHAVPTHLPTVEDAARAYEKALKDCFGRGSPRFDLILLGLGADGHVASLFPGRKTLDEKRRWVLPVRRSPKPPPERVTCSLALLNRARRIFILVGPERIDLAARILSGGAPTRPASRLRPRGELVWWLTAKP
jgi:6-phosphogluconolactonase